MTASKHKTRNRETKKIEKPCYKDSELRGLLIENTIINVECQGSLKECSAILEICQSVKTF